MLLKTLNRTLEEYNIPKEEFWEDPYGFIDKNEFMRRFNKYGFGVVPATTIINNYDNE